MCGGNPNEVILTVYSCLMFFCRFLPLENCPGRSQGLNNTMTKRTKQSTLKFHSELAILGELGFQED